LAVIEDLRGARQLYLQGAEAEAKDLGHAGGGGVERDEVVTVGDGRQGKIWWLGSKSRVRRV
jgi:hypothetical protein